MSINLELFTSQNRRRRWTNGRKQNELEFDLSTLAAGMAVGKTTAADEGQTLNRPPHRSASNRHEPLHARASIAAPLSLARVLAHACVRAAAGARAHYIHHREYCWNHQSEMGHPYLSYYRNTGSKRWLVLVPALVKRWEFPPASLLSRTEAAEKRSRTNGALPLSLPFSPCKDKAVHDPQ